MAGSERGVGKSEKTGIDEDEEDIESKKTFESKADALHFGSESTVSAADESRMRIGPCDEQLQWSSRLHAAQGQMLTADNTVCMIVFSNVTIDTGDVFSEKVWLCRDLCERRPVEGYRERNPGYSRVLEVAVGLDIQSQDRGTGRPSSGESTVPNVLQNKSGWVGC
eukprot:3594905-Rhodomonas_salina.3